MSVFNQDCNDCKNKGYFTVPAQGPHEEFKRFCDCPKGRKKDIDELQQHFRDVISKMRIKELEPQEYRRKQGLRRKF